MIHHIRDLTAADLESWTRSHRHAFEGTLGVALGRRYTTAFLRWFLERAGAICLAAVDDREIEGYVFGAPEGYSRELNGALAPEIVRGFLTHPGALRHPAVLRHVPMRIRGLFGMPVPAELAQRRVSGTIFDLVGIGTAPRVRGRGIGRAVLEAFEERVFAAGHAGIVLDVRTENAAARHLYESRGWTEVWSDERVARYQLDRRR